MKQHPKRLAKLMAVSAAAALFLTACGAGDSESAADGPVTLTFTWWGNEFLNKQTQAAIDAFEDTHPNILIKPQPGEWGSYWDKLATVTAGGDTPDIIQMDQKYIAEYGGRGALLDLSAQDGIDTSKIGKEDLASGQYEDKQYGLSTGINTYVIMANTSLFDAAGIPLPDDKTWTWEDYREIAADLSAYGNGESYGAAYGSNEGNFIIWLRQHGEQLYTADGKLGFETDTAAGFWKQIRSQLDEKASPPVTIFTEDNTAPLESSLFGTNKMAMSWWWTNQLGSLEATTGSDIKMLRRPSTDGAVSSNGMYYKPTMFWSASSRTEHPEEATEFINFLVNDTAAGESLLTDRGVPTNPEVKESITSALSPANAEVLDFLAEIEPDVDSAPPVPPVGASDVQNVIARYTAEVLAGTLSPEEAASTFKDEVEGMISRAG
ncbi:multiple sugar transport system substrate-binding protein [Arthrobacter sp. UYP6]|uniref:ABC transporter substrate-binding protein n=1 Tax=Arthrobacter sp. UYP6 TaxID=1756378 RepID=UPI003394B3F2